MTRNPHAAAGGSDLVGARSKERDPIINTRDIPYWNYVPALYRNQFQEIGQGVGCLPPMLVVNYSLTPGEERKRRRENEDGMFSKQVNFLFDILLLESSEDDRSEDHFLATSSGLRTGRSQ